jgi:hypothetical protein
MRSRSCQGTLLRKIWNLQSYILWADERRGRPDVARYFYSSLFRVAELELPVHEIAYALDEAVAKLHAAGVPASRWAWFIHMSK